MNWKKSSYSIGNGQCVEVRAWRKSSRSFANGNCAEVATRPGAVLVRDSKNPTGPALPFGADVWREFTASIKTPLA